MNDTIKIILATLETGRPELQVAAAQILGELRPKDAAIVRALAASIGRSAVLGRFALDALAKIGSHEARAAIAEAMLAHESLADHAAMLLIEAREAAHDVLIALHPAASPEQRGRILQILVRAPSKAVADVFVHALLEPEVGDAAARLILDSARQADAWSPPAREALGKRLGAALADFATLPEASVVRLVEVLHAVDPVGSRGALAKLAAPGQPLLVRAAALRSLRGSKLSAGQVQEFLAMLEDPAQRELHDAVRDVLGDLPEVPKPLVLVLKRLLAARHPEQRLFALRMLRTAGGLDMAKIAIKHLDHEDPRFVAAAAEALAHNKQAVEPLVRLLLTSRDPALQRAVAGVLVRLGAHVPPRTQKALGEKAVKLLSTNTRLGDLILDTVLAIGGARIVPSIVEKAVRMRRARRHPEALHLLAKVMASEHGTAEARYQLALTRLLVDLARPQAEAPAGGDPTMGFFAALIRDGFPLGDRLRKEAAVTADALLRIAMHFARSVGPERRFGTDLLQHLATRTKGHAGDEAKLALRAVGT